MGKKWFFKAALVILISSIFAALSSTPADNLPLQLLYKKNGDTTRVELGYSASMAGDVNGDGYADFIAGAPFARSGGNFEAGSAFVYSGKDGSLLFEKYGETAGDEFGFSVSSAGDVDGDGKKDFIVGAAWADTSFYIDAGAAYVYSGATGTLLYKVKGPIGSNFGWSVSSVGDADGDGKSEFIVGALYASPNGLSLAGSAFVYSGVSGSLLYRIDGAHPSDFLGHSVSGAGDVNGDGRADFIVGAHYADPFSLTDAGSAFVYSGATGELLHQKHGSSANDGFGNAVSGAGDVNGDGKDDFIIGAFYTDSINNLDSITNVGAVFVYSGNDGSLLYKKMGTSDWERLGTSVGAAGDIDGDANDDFIVGGPYVGTPYPQQGYAVVYSGTNGSILFEVYATISSEGLGCSIDGADDINGDGRPDIVIGSWGADSGGLFDIGSVFVYGLAPTDAPEEKSNRPERFELSQNYPNPFNPTTTIQYFLPKRENVTLEIFNLLGERVRVLVEEEQTAGGHTAVWDGKDENRRILSSGIYFYRLKSESFSEIKKMIFLK